MILLKILKYFRDFFDKAWEIFPNGMPLWKLFTVLVWILNRLISSEYVGFCLSQKDHEYLFASFFFIYDVDVFL